MHKSRVYKVKLSDGPPLFNKITVITEDPIGDISIRHRNITLKFKRITITKAEFEKMEEHYV